MRRQDFRLSLGIRMRRQGFRLSFRKSRVPHKTTALYIAEYEFMIPHPMADSYTAKEHFYGRRKAFRPRGLTVFQFYCILPREGGPYSANVSLQYGRTGRLYKLLPAVREGGPSSASVFLKLKYTYADSATVRMSAVTCDHTIPYIPIKWLRMKSMGMLKAAQRMTPRNSDLSPLPKP